MRTLDNHFPSQQYAPQPPANQAWMNAPAPAHVPTAAPGAEGKGLMIAGYIMVGLTLADPAVRPAGPDHRDHHRLREEDPARPRRSDHRRLDRRRRPRVRPVGVDQHRLTPTRRRLATRPSAARAGGGPFVVWG